LRLKLSDISKSYGSNLVLDNLNLELRQGEILGLLGRNGVGKTTLLKIIANISQPDAGSIDYPRDNRNIGYLSERNPLYPNMYIPEYLNWISNLTESSDKMDINEVISQVGLNDVIGTKVGQLSKGYKQRVGLAAAMISNPDILILDEPINGLDPVQIEEYRQVVKSLGQDRIIILSSHLMQEVEAICDRVVVIDNGQIQKDINIKSRADIFAIRLELDKPLAADDFNAIEGITAVNSITSTKYKLIAKEDVRVQIFDLVVVKGLKIKEMTLVNQTLDNLF